MNMMNKTRTLTIAGLLSAIGILIPLAFPKVIIGPASYTLASHVPIIIAMFISPSMALTVSLITTFGFFMASYPIVIVMRALTHVIFAGTGALILQKNDRIFTSIHKSALFTFFISLIHAMAEVAIVTVFFVSDPTQYDNYFKSIFLLVGVGTLIHSFVDFTIASFVWQPLQRIVSIPANVKIQIHRKKA